MHRQSSLNFDSEANMLIVSTTNGNNIKLPTCEFLDQESPDQTARTYLESLFTNNEKAIILISPETIVKELKQMSNRKTGGKAMKSAKKMAANYAIESQQDPFKFDIRLCNDSSQMQMIECNEQKSRSSANIRVLQSNKKKRNARM